MKTKNQNKFKKSETLLDDTDEKAVLAALLDKVENKLFVVPNYGLRLTNGEEATCYTSIEKALKAADGDPEYYDDGVIIYQAVPVARITVGKVTVQSLL